MFIWRGLEPGLLAALLTHMAMRRTEAARAGRDPVRGPGGPGWVAPSDARTDPRPKDRPAAARAFDKNV